MKSAFLFTDKEGAEWDVVLTMASARRIDKSDFSALTESNVSILAPGKEFLLELLTSPPLLMAVIWAVVQPQVESNLGIDASQEPQKAEEEFLSRLTGPVVVAAREAFWRSLAHFFPDQETVLSGIWDQWRKAQEELAKIRADLIPRLGPILKREIQKEKEKLRKDLESIGAPSTL